jgi:ribosomal protein S18 acetylase RimI-like enzyme
MRESTVATLTFRAALAQDAETVSAVISSAFGPETTPGWSEPALERFRLENTPDKLTECFAAASFQQVCEVDDTTIGYIYLSKPHLISLVAVHPKYQRKGVASALLDAAMERLDQNGSDVSVVEVSSTDYSSPFYLAKGFYPISPVLTFEGCRFTRMGFWRGLRKFSRPAG